MHITHNVYISQGTNRGHLKSGYIVSNYTGKGCTDRSEYIHTNHSNKCPVIWQGDYQNSNQSEICSCRFQCFTLASNILWVGVAIGYHLYTFKSVNRSGPKWHLLYWVLKLLECYIPWQFLAFACWTLQDGCKLGMYWNEYNWHYRFLHRSWLCNNIPFTWHVENHITKFLFVQSKLLIIPKMCSLNMAIFKSWH